MSVVAGLATGHDVIMLQEAHGSPGVYEAWSGIRGFIYIVFPAGANTGRAGVGLLISGSFLKNFVGPQWLQKFGKDELSRLH